MAILDGFNRKIDYLRLSVIDRCNLRCVYCLPEVYDRFTPVPETLTDQEILTLASCFAELGFSKIRITGGEPLLRPGLEDIIAGIARLPGVRDIAISTNGVLLPQRLEKLAAAGLKRVNISLDSLQEDRFAKITRHGKIDSVLAGIRLALDLGLSPVKLNVVVARGMNEDEIDDFVRLTEDQDIHVRFIELMPMGETGFFSRDRWVNLEEMMDKSGPLDAIAAYDRPAGNGPARYFRRPGAKGTVGFISALSCGFCSSCNRVRLSSKGVLFPCLDEEEGTDLRGPLRLGAGKEQIKQSIVQTIREKKPERHFMLERATDQTEKVSRRMMCQVGG